MHAHYSLHAFNILIHPNMWQTYQDKGENRTWFILAQLLAQAEESRSGESVLSLRQAPFA